MVCTNVRIRWVASRLGRQLCSVRCYFFFSSRRRHTRFDCDWSSDVCSSDLTGSPAARRANDWTLERFKAYGLDAHLESWQFGGTWTRGPMRARLTAPLAHDVIAASWAWAPGTGGVTITGPVVRIDATKIGR